MLTEWPATDLARAVKTIRDITETDPIPKGALVFLQDFDSCAEVWIVEYADRIYLATPDELSI